MRNRQWVSAWVFEKGLNDNVIEKLSRNGKTYFNNITIMKNYMAYLTPLREVQRIKSEDYESAKL
jgi:dipeptidyl-peptidase-3